MRPVVARGAAQVVECGPQAASRCASRVLDRVVQAAARGAARCASQVLDRGAQVVAAAPKIAFVVIVLVDQISDARVNQNFSS
jgi:hypothetical protein